MKHVYKSIFSSMYAKYIAYAVQFSSLMILTRLFTPEQFGVIAAIQVFYIFFQILTEAGLSTAIINLKKLNTSERDGIFGLSIFIGFAAGSAFYILSPLIIIFYDINELDKVIPYTTLAIIFSAWLVLPQALLQRQQLFSTISISICIAEFTSLLYIYLSINKIDPITALASRLPIVVLINFFMLYYFSKNTEFKRPKIGLKFQSVRKLLNTSNYQLGFNLLNFLSRNLDNILVGKFFGPSMLGIYDRSYMLMRYPLQLLSFAMSPAIQPALRDHINEPNKVYDFHQDLVFKLSIIGTLCGLIFYFYAEIIISIAFGKQWINAANVIQILALSIPAQVVLSTSGSFFQAFNRTDLLFKCGLFSSTVNVTAISIGIWLGTLEYLCWSILISFHINFIQAYVLLHKHIFLKSSIVFFKSMLPAASIVLTLIFLH